MDQLKSMNFVEGGELDDLTIELKDNFFYHVK